MYWPCRFRGRLAAVPKFAGRPSHSPKRTIELRKVGLCFALFELLRSKDDMYVVSELAGQQLEDSAVVRDQINIDVLSSHSRIFSTQKVDFGIWTGSREKVVTASA